MTAHYVWHGTPRTIADQAEAMAFHALTQHGNHSNEALIDAPLRIALHRLALLQSAISVEILAARGNA